MGRLADALRSYWMKGKVSSDPTLGPRFGYGPSAAGINVNETTALNYSALWAGVRAISEPVASLPLFLFRRLLGGGRERFTNHRLHRLLHDEFNPEMTSTIARETMQAHALTWGNAYAEIERNGAGEAVAIWPLTPNRVTPDRPQPDGPIVYRVTRMRGPDDLIPAEDMIHIPGLSFDGLIGYSVVSKMRESIGLGLATEKFGAAFFGNGAWPGLVSQHPGKMSDAAHKRLKESINEILQGPGKAHNVLILEEGQKVEKVGIPPDDAQFLQTRLFQVTEMCRWLNLSPYKLRDLQHSAVRANIEHEGIEFVTSTLRPWFVRWEQELNRKLIRPLERNIQYIEHVVDGLLRGDIASRYSAYAVGRQWGWLSADDIRDLENMNPLPDGQGQIYLVPQNMAPADQADELIKPDPAPAPAPAPTPEPQPRPRQAPAPDAPKPDPGTAAKIIAAQRAIFIEGVGRMVRKEANAARRASRKGTEGLRAWIAEFYPKHEGIFAAAVLPAMQAHLSQVNGSVDPTAQSRTLARTYIEASRAQLHQLLDATPDDLEGAVDALVSRWEIERPAQLADAIMTEEIAHALA